MDKQQITGSELENRLADDPQGIERDRLVEQLESEARRQKAAIDRGVSPADFALIDKQYQSLLCAAKLVGTIWRANQPAR